MGRFHDDAGNIQSDKFGIKDATDPTKIAVFSLSGLTTATKRTFTLPDASASVHVAQGTVGTTATYTLTAAETGKVFVGTRSSATQTYTLPTTPAAGTTFTFVCGDAGGEILITPAAAEKISCKATVDAGANVAPAAGTGIKNTAATNVKSDMISLMFDGTDTWWMTAQSGIWASQ